MLSHWVYILSIRMHRFTFKVTNSWYSPEAEKAAAATLLDMNCDVITQHCDTLYPQTLAQERGVYSIGYNSDMSKDAPNACLCSVIWNWSAYYTLRYRVFWTERGTAVIITAA